MVIVMPIEVSAPGTVSKGQEKRLGKLDLRGRIRTIQTTVMLRSSRICRRVLETGGELLLLRLQWKARKEHDDDDDDDDNNNNNDDELQMRQHGRGCKVEI